MSFDRVIVVDWSAASSPTSAKPSADAIWLGTARVSDGSVAEGYRRTRAEAEAALHDAVREALAAGERLLIGFDFPFGYPAGFARALTGRPEALALWDWLAERIEDGPDNRNHRFEVAAAINATLPGTGPFWGRPAGLDLPDLPAQGSAREGHPFAERREVERAVPRAQPVWKLYTTGSVGSQALMGIPALARLRAAFPGRVAAWPFEPWEAAPVVLAEVYPSLLAAEVAALLPKAPESARGNHGEPVKDAVQVRLLAGALAQLAAEGALDPLFRPEADPGVLAEEGWILGAGQETLLRAAVPSGLTPPRLKNDCFAMPQGVDWVPVDEALARLRSVLHPVAAVERLPVAEAAGRVLAEDCRAVRSNPPAANSAVDGYGFAHAATGAGPQRLPLVEGRAAAGQPFAGRVPEGAALRVLTGAILPDGVDTVVLEEDTATDGAAVVFDGPIRRGANTRRAGEDVEAGAIALRRGQGLRAPDIALLTALGIAEVPVFRRLRVGVLSTGDEIVTAPGAATGTHQIYDANRPMLLAIAARWGYAPVDLGHVRDDEAEIAERLSDGSARADVILTSGGASAGDEDHVSRVLRERGALSSWRIALKPGRPLALALWQGVPVFGLPGNPVAAFVCALIFARPALAAMAGAPWPEPVGFTVPAGFAKSKKPGRREYLRARLDDEGRAEVFASEGSGRISGLSWATGLVELPDGAAEIVPGTPVRFLPYSGFGL